jgi:ATP-dependent RNA helicase RhlB
LDAFNVPLKEGETRFHDLDLPVELMHAIADLGFQYCTPIQAKVLPHVRGGRNVAGRAQTGTGKTAAFLIAIFARFLERPIQGKRPSGTPRALVLAPTRELVMQIVKDAEAIGTYAGVRCLAVYGGADMEAQRRQLTGGVVDLLAATPGRLLDFQRRGVLKLGQVETLVIDEADRMLDMGFIPDVKRIVRTLPYGDKRRTLLFSATLTEDVRRLAAQWMPNPVSVEIEPEQVTVDTVDQLVYATPARLKFRLLYHLLQQDACKRVLVFTNRRDRTQRLTQRLLDLGVRCEQLSGAVAQNKRVKVLEDFRSGRVPVLIATDVAGRGIHVENVTHVINYDFPYEADDYVHRIGRTGRAGTTGQAISFACEDESFVIPEIEAYIGRELPCKQPDETLLVPTPPPKRREHRSDASPQVRTGGHAAGNRRSSGARRRSSRGGRSGSAHSGRSS